MMAGGRIHKEAPTPEEAIYLLLDKVDSLDEKVERYNNELEIRTHKLEMFSERQKASEDTRNAFVKFGIGIGSIVVGIISFVVSWIVAK